MKRTEIAAVYADSALYAGKEVTVCGWVRTVRDMKTFGFIELNDGSCFKNLQIVFEDGKIENYKEVAKILTGASLHVVGKFKYTPDSRQPFEVEATEIEIIGNSDEHYPLQKKRHTMEYLREIPHLRVRTNTFMAVMRLRSVLSMAIHEFFQEAQYF